MKWALMVEKKIKGRKRHIVTDTQGHLLHINVHKANIHDTVAGGEVFASAVKKYPTLQGVCADQGYRGTMEKFVTTTLGKIVEISARLSNEWKVITKRWVVERTFGWLNSWRRLSKDYEKRTDSAENMIMVAHSMLLLARLA